MSNSSQPDQGAGEQTTNAKDQRTRIHRKRLAQLKSTNLALDPSSTYHRSIVIHPGLAPEAVDGFGNPSILGVVTMMQAARQMAMHSPGTDGHCFLDMDMLRENHLTFMGSAVFNVTRYAYNTDEKKHPLRVELEVGHVGRTSFSFVITVTLPSEQVMVTAVHQAILIDPATRRPTPLPEEWCERYRPLAVNHHKLVVPKQCPPDPGTGSLPTQALQTHPHHRLTVAWSDTDHNNHTNFASYIRFALDALYPAVREGTLDGCLTRAELESGVSEMKIAYLGESSEGDVLLVQLWCPQAGERTVVCDIDKEGGQSVCQVTLTFHPQ